MEELDKVLLKDRNLFPNSPEVWLKDLASQLNVYLDKIPDPDPLCNGKPHGSLTSFSICFTSFFEISVRPFACFATTA